MKRDWRKPFLELKAELRPLYDANLTIDHAVLLSTSRTAQELAPIVDMLEPAYRKRKLAKSIPVDTDGCTYHGHVFVEPVCGSTTSTSTPTSTAVTGSTTS